MPTVQPRERAVEDLCRRSIHLMADGDLAGFGEVYAPDAANRESASEPPECRGRGPSAFLGSARWLHAAFDDLAWEVHDVVVEDGLAAVHATMSGRHVRPFVVFGADGRPAQAFPPTGRTFAVTQTHWFRVADGRIVEHWANRDDQGLAVQLGWVPPSPAYLLKMRRALGAARRTS